VVRTVNRIGAGRCPCATGFRGRFPMPCWPSSWSSTASSGSGSEREIGIARSEPAIDSVVWQAQAASLDLKGSMPPASMVVAVRTVR